MADLAELRAAGQKRETAGPVRRPAQEGHGLAGLLGGVDPGDHDPVGSEVERTADAQALTGCGTHDRGRFGGANRVEVLQQVGLAGRAVLEIDDQPVGATPRTELRGEWRTEVEEHAIRRLAGAEAGAQVWLRWRHDELLGGRLFSMMTCAAAPVTAR